MHKKPLTQKPRPMQQDRPGSFSREYFALPEHRETLVTLACIVSVMEKDGMTPWRVELFRLVSKRFVESYALAQDKA